MRPILPGTRGPAVEDIQRRLLRLGYQLGPTGVDGVFLGRTREAVLAFQSTLGLAEDGVVGDETWSALVDETFTLGDRTLYLRLPYFHGKDVSQAQVALNALGFACGDLDGIFGAFTERAVREFQRNSGLVADGILGITTVHALLALRHVWEGKDASIPPGATTGPVRSPEALARLRVRVSAAEGAKSVAERIVNLAQASSPGCGVRLADDPESAPDGLPLRLVTASDDTGEALRVPIGTDTEAAFAVRLRSALGEVPEQGIELLIEGTDDLAEADVAQRLAVRVLDGLEAALA